MEMKVEKSFYILEKKEKERSITLYSDMSETVKKVAEHMKGGIPADHIELSMVDVEKKELRVAGIPWSTIAEKLVKEK